MLKLFYTDYKTNDDPLPNGFDPNESRTDVWKTGDLHMLLDIAGQPFTFTTATDDPFIFPIHLRLTTDNTLYKPLSTIVPENIVSFLNSHGYLLVTDDEGYTKGPSVIYKECKSVGINCNRVIYLSRNLQLIKHYDNSFYYNEAWNQYFYNLQRGSFRSALAEVMREPCVYKVTALSGRADPHKIFMLNELYRSHLLADANISFRLPLPNRNDTEYLTSLIDSTLLDKFNSFAFDYNPVQYDSEGNPYTRYSDPDGLLQTVLEFRLSKIAIFNASPMGKYNRSKQYKWGWMNIGFAPIVLSQRPFLLNGEYPNMLPYLREHGFKTFDGIIDESYDTIDDCELRAKAIASEVLRLTDEDLKKCESITTYNLKHFFKLNYNRDTSDHILRLLNA